jgi:L-iditol 2-dehydrogenase
VWSVCTQRRCVFPTDAVRREISPLFSYSCNYAGYQTALDLLGSGAIDPDPLFSKCPLRDAPKALEAVGQGRTVKAMLLP